MLPKYILKLLILLLLLLAGITKLNNHFFSFTNLDPDARPYSKQAMIPQNCKFGIVGSSIVASINDIALTANRSPAQ